MSAHHTHNSDCSNPLLQVWNDYLAVVLTDLWPNPAMDHLVAEWFSVVQVDRFWPQSDIHDMPCSISQRLCPCLATTVWF